MKRNIHIYQSPMTHESRIFKTVKTISANFHEIVLLGVGADNLPKTEVLYPNVIIKRSPNFSSKLLRFLVYYVWVFFQLVKTRKKVLTIHSLELLPFVFLAKLMRTKVVYDAHELETEKNGMGGLRKKTSKIVEKIGIKFCDKVIVVGFKIADFYQESYGLKPYVILNIPYLNNSQLNTKNLFREEFPIQGSDVIFLYQGLLGKGRGIENLIETFKQLPQTNKKLVFMGYGTLQDEVKEAAKNCVNIFYKEAVSPEKVLDYTQSSDFGLSLIENTSLSYYYCLPNKLFEYTQAEIPVIVSDNIEMKDIVTKNNIGYSIANNTDSLKNLLLTLDKSSLADFKPSLITFKNKFNWEAQEATLKEIYTFN